MLYTHHLSSSRKEEEEAEEEEGGNGGIWGGGSLTTIPWKLQIDSRDSRDYSDRQSAWRTMDGGS